MNAPSLSGFDVLSAEHRRGVAGALAVAGVVAGVLVAVDSAGTLLGPVRAVATVVFMILGPGWAIAGFLRRSAPALVWAVAVAVGCAVGGLGAQAMLAAGWWHPDAALVLLVLLCVPALVWHVVRRR